MSKKQYNRAIAIAVIVTVLIALPFTYFVSTNLTAMDRLTVTSIVVSPTTVYRTVTVAETTGETRFVTTTPTQEAGKRGGVLTIAVEKDEPTLDPLFAQAGVFSDTIQNHIYDSLLSFDYKMRIVPRLAESYRQVDPLTYEFRLRSGVRFHDNTPLNAQVVKWNLDRVITTASPRQSQLNMVDRVDVVDDLTIRITLKYPTSEFLPALTWGVWIVSKDAVDRYGQDYGTAAAVGTGPYRLVEWVKGSHAVLERFDGYWGPKALIDRIILRVIPEPSVRALSLERGEVQLAQLEPTDAKRLQTRPNIKVFLGEPSRVIMLSINLDPVKQGSPPLLDKRVRQAINYAIDRKALAEAIQEGFAVAGIGPIPPALKQYWEITLKKYPDTGDLEKAWQLLREAGYPNGFKTRLLNFFPWGLPVATVIQAQLAKLGIDVEINNVEFGLGAEQLLVKREYDLALHDWAGTGSPTPFGVVGQFFNSDQTGPWQWNLQNIKDSQLDMLLTELLIQTDPLAQKGLSDALQRRVIEEAYGVFLYYPYKIHASTSTVKNYVVHPHQWYGFVIWIPSLGATVWLDG